MQRILSGYASRIARREREREIIAMGNTQATDVHEEFEEINLVRPTREQVDATFEQLVVSPARKGERKRERE